MIRAEPFITGLFKKATWLAAVSLLLACTAVPVTRRQAFIVTTEEQERALGAEAYKQVLGEGTVSGNHRWRALLDRVGKRIAAATGRPDYDWRFTVFEGETPNAFAFPGGKVGVTTGMMELVDNEAQLAAVVAHEVAHATARHGGERLTAALGARLGFRLLREILEGPATPRKERIIQALGLGVTLAGVLPFSRMQEHEADEIGLTYMARAGYDPNAAVRLWGKMARRPDALPEFLSTHPSSESRVRRLRMLVAEVGSLYESSPRYGLGVPLEGALAE